MKRAECKKTINEIKTSKYLYGERTMKLPIHIAKKLQHLLQPGTSIASSAMQHAVVTKMLEDGLLQKQQTGNTKALLFIHNKQNVAAYLSNHFGISNLQEYIAIIEGEEQSRAANVAISGNSKLQAVRTFKGFLVNSYDAVNAELHGNPMIIHPLPGSFTFIYDYDSFVPDPAVTIVGIENPENFRQVEKQRYLFTHIQPLFVSRYPQNNDLVKWLTAIPNKYLHFGDLDFAGISIYQNEYKKHLGERATFFLPENMDLSLQKFGNRDLFNRQYNATEDYTLSREKNVQEAFRLLLKYKKALEQELFINGM
ncbi:MAG: hypothetical protein H7211_02415 [Aquabacterium sp.]|nr:hypothetical protein [Ferruginibacter sp.]